MTYFLCKMCGKDVIFCRCGEETNMHDQLDQAAYELERLLDQIIELEAKVAKYEARLEIDCLYDINGVRIEVPPNERETIYDGIKCRDLTIKIQQEYIDRLEEMLDRHPTSS